MKFTELTKEIEAAGTGKAGVVALITGISSEIEKNAKNSAGLEAFAKGLVAASDSLAEAAVANKPIAPPNAPPPNVAAEPLPRVEVDPHTAKVRLGGTQQFKAKGRSADEKVNVTWSVESNIGSMISKDGLYTAGKPSSPNSTQIEEVVTATPDSTKLQAGKAIVTVQIKSS